ncbi:MAG TPA: hypothetical protein VED40_05105 [Azospirillaceae bacterium]|nr:hypothetical protein [Azospirillaceae bacterium]
MTAWFGDSWGWWAVGGGMLLYLLLMARSAHIQGELGQFLRGLLFVALLLGGLFLLIEGWIWVDQHW